MECDALNELVGLVNNVCLQFVLSAITTRYLAIHYHCVGLCD